MTARRRIFLAHAKEDKEQVRKLYADLKAAGFDPWLDEEDLIPGQDWVSVITEEIRQAGIFLACLSSRSVGKQGFVQTEFRMALSAYGERPPGTIYLIPVKLDDCDIPDLNISHQGLSLRSLHWVELSQDDGFRHLLRGVRHGLDIGPEERQEPVPQPAGEAVALLAEIDRLKTTHPRRAEIGRRLDEIGDPRPGIGVDADDTPQIDWCEVPGGEVFIEVDYGPPIQKRVDTFHIARFPVTVAQYRAFLTADDGWRTPDWWGTDLERDPKGDSHEFGLFGNHPVVEVNWFDAMAFCRWLSRRLGFAVRLPDDWEWQQAATGGNPGNAFPWGAKWDLERQPHLASTWESEVHGPAAVGMYPAGATPQGIQDMAGTVWEWCQNKYDVPEVLVSKANDCDPRPIRGGSWINGNGSARCGVRDWHDPRDRTDDVGFRVLCSSPIFDH